MSLFPEVDAKKTALKVDEFFKKDYERFYRMSADSSVKATVFGGIKTGSTENQAEKLGVKRAFARDVIKIVYMAILNCDEFSAKILKLRYVEHNTKDSICDLIGYSPSGYDLRKARALNEFADVFESLAEPLLYEKSDLHVYKKEHE